MENIRTIKKEEVKDNEEVKKRFFQRKYFSFTKLVLPQEREIQKEMTNQDTQWIFQNIKKSEFKNNEFQKIWR